MTDKRRKFDLSEELQNRLQMIAKTTGQSLQSALSHSLFLGTNVFLGRGQTGVTHDPGMGSQENFVRGQSGVNGDPIPGSSLAGASVESNKLDSSTNTNTSCVGVRESKKRKKDLTEDEKISLEAIFEKWNSTVKSLPPVKGKTNKRFSSCQQRIKEGYDLGELFAKVEASDFLTNRFKTSERGWSANFDWVIRPTNCPRVAEGQFDNTSTQTKHFDESRFDPNKF